MSRFNWINIIVVASLAIVVAGRLAVGADAKTAKASGTSAAAKGHAEPDHDDGHDGEHEHGAHQETVYGKPPKGILGKGTEFLNVAPPLFIWTLIVFLGTAIVLRQLAWKPILDAIESREHRVEKSLHDAEAARLEAERLMSLHDEQMARAQDRAREILDKARAEATQQSDLLINEARQKAAEAQMSAEAAIASAAKDAVEQIGKAGVDLASSVVSKLIGRSVDKAAIAKVMAEVNA